MRAVPFFVLVLALFTAASPLLRAAEDPRVELAAKLNGVKPEELRQSPVPVLVVDPDMRGTRVDGSSGGS